MVIPNRAKVDELVESLFGDTYRGLHKSWDPPEDRISRAISIVGVETLIRRVPEWVEVSAEHCSGRILILTARCLG